MTSTTPSFIVKLEDHFRKNKIPKQIPSQNRCSTVAILRIITKTTVDDGDDDKVELLFIKRTEREQDRWSGHVAFPGGKRDATDSSDRHCAERETNEEIGWDLQNTEHFRYLGQLRDVLVWSKWDMVLCTFVYVMNPHPVSPVPAMTLSPNEVAAVAWIPITKLSPTHVRFDLRSLPRPGTWPFESKWLHWIYDTQ
eukprot:PhF_6_TR7344/c0_g1_i1/m.11037